MADVKLTSTLLSHADMDVILKGIKAYIDAEVTNANGDTTAVATKVNTLIGSDNAKSVRTISAEEVAKIVAGADSNYDTLKEIADWIKSDTTGAAKMANDIANALEQIGVKAAEGKEATGLYKLIADEKARAEKAEKDIQDTIDAHEASSSTALTDHSTRLEALENKFTGQGSVEGQIATAKQEAIDAAAADATTKKGEAISAAAADATTKVNALKNTAVSSTKTSGPVAVTLGGSVGAPTVDVAVTMATEAQVQTLVDMFKVEENA